MKPVREKVSRYTIVLFLGAFLFPISAAAAVVMESYIGFNGIFKLNTWTPVAVIIENRDRSLNGSLQVVATSGTEYRRNLHDTIYSQDISLPANTKKRFAFTIYLDNFSRPLTIRLTVGERVIAEESISLRTRYTTLPLIVGIGSKLSPDALSNFPAEVYPLTVRPPFLPETRFGYDGVDLLVLDAAILADLNHKQFQALYRWLQAGGFITVAGRTNFGFFATARAQKLFGLQMTGFEQLSEIKALQTFCGQPLIADGPFLVLRTKAAFDEVIVSENGIPIVVKKLKHRGHLVFLAFDHRTPPFRNWIGQTAFWRQILALAPISPPTPAELPADHIVAALTEAIGFKFPGFWLILVCTTAFVTCGHLTLKCADQGLLRLRTAMKRLTLIVCLFTAGGGFLYLFEHVKSTLRYNGFLQLSLTDTAGMADGTYTLGLYALKQQWVQFDLGRGFHPVRPLMSAAGGAPSFKPAESGQFAPHRIELHDTGRGMMIRTTFADWSQRFFRLAVQVPLPLTGKADLDEKSLVVQINNPSSHTLIDCQLFFRGRILAVGDLAADDRRRIQIPTSVFKNDHTQSDRNYANGQSFNRSSSSPTFYRTIVRDLADQLVEGIQQRYNGDSNHLCMFGWLASSIYPVNVGEKLLPGNHLTFFEWRIPVT